MPNFTKGDIIRNLTGGIDKPIIAEILEVCYHDNSLSWSKGFYKIKYISPDDFVSHLGFEYDGYWVKISIKPEIKFEAFYDSFFYRSSTR